MRLLALKLLPNGIPAGETFTADNEIQGRLLIQAGVARLMDEEPRLIKRLIKRKPDPPATD